VFRHFEEEVVMPKTLSLAGQNRFNIGDRCRLQVAGEKDVLRANLKKGSGK